MSQMEFEMQFADIMIDGQFSEWATIETDDASYHVKGIFYSGSYEDSSVGAYTPKKSVGRDYFQLATCQLHGMERMWETVKGATLECRGVSYRVYDVSGRRGGVLNLELQELEGTEED